MSTNHLNRDALVVGICQYDYLNDDARGATNLATVKALTALAEQAEALAKLLETQGGFKVTRLPCAADLTLDLKRRVTLSELKQAIEKLLYPPEESPTQTALLFFAGHGLVEETQLGKKVSKEGFLATTEAEGRSVYGFSLKRLRDLLRNSPVKQQIVFLESCHSGEFFTNFQSDTEHDYCFVTSARAHEEALAEGLLTQALLNILGDSSKGYVLSEALLEQLRDQSATTKGWQRFEWKSQGKPMVLINQAFSQTPSEHAKPYKGLHYFDNKPEDALFFKGREKLIAELLTKVTEKSFLAILGASGNGKSSVVRAGVLYQLQQTERWQIVNPFTPTANPLTALTNGLGTREVLAFVQASAKARVLLTIDQFEEVFSLCQDSQARETFFNTLLDAVEQATDKFCLIVVMRADFLDKCSNYPRLARYFQDHQHIVTRPTEDEIQQIIEEPAKQAGLLVEPQLVAEMRTDFKDSVGGLPLLEFALTTLWEKGKADRLLRYTDYQALGRIQGILEKKATEIYEKTLTPAEQVVAKRVFLELTELGEGKPDTRRLVPQTDLLSFATRTASPSRTGSPESSQLVEQVIAKLVKEHLIVTDQTKVTVVNIAHDALIEQWSVLKKWLDQSRDDLKLQRQINEGAKAWKEGKKALLVGVDLARAEEYLGTHWEKVALLGVGVEFVKASIAAREKDALERERQRRERERLQRRNLRVLAVSFVVAVVLGLFGWWQWGEAKKQEEMAKQQTVVAEENAKKAKEETTKAEKRKNEALRGQSLLLANFARQETERGNATNGILLALEALPKDMANPDRPYVFEAEVSLYHAVFQAREYKVFHGNHEENIKQITFSPDGSLLASIDYSYGTINLWNVDNGKMITMKDLENYESDNDWGFIEVIFNSKGNLLASWRYKTDKINEYEGSTVVWENNTGEIIASFPGRTTGFSPDGKSVVTTQSDKAVLWDIETTEQIKELDFKTLLQESFPKNGLTHYTQVLLDSKGRYIAVIPKEITQPEENIQPKVIFWDIKENKVWNITPECEHLDEFTVSPDGQKIAFWSGGKEGVCVWDVEHNKPLFSTDCMENVLFSPDSNYLFTNCFIGGNSLPETGGGQLWSTGTGELQTVIGEGKYGVNSIDFSSDNKQLVVGGNDGIIRLFEVPGFKVGEEIASFTTTEPIIDWSAIPIVKFSPHNRWIATAGTGDGNIHLWHLKDLGEPLDVDIPEGKSPGATPISFSADGKRLLGSDFNGDSEKFYGWDVETGQLVQPRQGDYQYFLEIQKRNEDYQEDYRKRGGGAYYAVPDFTGERELLCVFKEFPVLWDVKLDKQLMEIASRHDQQNREYIDFGLSGVQKAAISPDGRHMATSGGSIRIWRYFPTTQSLIDYANQIVPRRLTAEQRKRFFLE